MSEQLVQSRIADEVLYHALLRARENAREKDWPRDVKTLQRAIDAAAAPASGAADVTDEAGEIAELLPLSVNPMTPSVIKTATGMSIAISWTRSPAENPYALAESFAAFAVRAINAYATRPAASGDGEPIPFRTLMRAGRLFQAISLVARDKECVLLIAQALHCSTSPAASGDGDAAARDVLAERERQKTVEGWAPEHDDDYAHFELARAASCYAAEAAEPTRRPAEEGDRPYNWPWNSRWWKPSGRRRNLVKAGALILAEIERLDRAALASPQAATEFDHG